MKITLLTVGKTDVKWVRDGLELYVSRLVHYVPFQLREIPELKNVSALGREQVKAREGDLVLKAVRPSDEVVLLDEGGREFRSLEFASWLEERISRGSRDIVFVVGGAYGFSPEVYARADAKLSLSKMTFSHQMVRTIFAEQLYRAFTIMKGEPYHHELREEIRLACLPVLGADAPQRLRAALGHRLRQLAGQYRPGREARREGRREQDEQA